MKKPLLLPSLIATLVLTLSLSAHAVPVTFFGEDLNFTDDLATLADDPIRPGSLPNSDAARASFLSNLTGTDTESFEGFQSGSRPDTLTFGTDTATLIGSPTITNTPSGTFNGVYPTSGDQFLFHFGPSGSFKINFSNPQAAFGFYATDVGDGGAQLALVLDLLAGGTTTIAVPHSTSAPAPTNISGSALYFGLIDTVDTFTAVTFSNNLSALDGFGFDDLTIGRTDNVVAPVPEPSTIALLIIGLLGARLVRKRAQHCVTPFGPEAARH